MRKETSDKRNRAMGHLRRPGADTGSAGRSQRGVPDRAVDRQYPCERLAAAYLAGSSRSAAELMQ